MKKISHTLAILLLALAAGLNAEAINLFSRNKDPNAMSKEGSQVWKSSVKETDVIARDLKAKEVVLHAGELGRVSGVLTPKNAGNFESGKLNYVTREKDGTVIQQEIAISGIPEGSLLDPKYTHLQPAGDNGISVVRMVEKDRRQVIITDSFETSVINGKSYRVRTGLTHKELGPTGITSIDVQTIKATDTAAGKIHAEISYGNKIYPIDVPLNDLNGKVVNYSVTRSEFGPELSIITYREGTLHKTMYAVNVESGNTSRFQGRPIISQDLVGLEAVSRTEFRSASASQQSTGFRGLTTSKQAAGTR